MSIVDAQSAAQVTANSGVLSGLDKGVAQPEVAHEPDEEKAQGPTIESRKCKMVFPVLAI